MNPKLAHDVLVAVFTVAAAFILVRQCRKPVWWPGQLFLQIMNVSHSGVTSWGLTHVSIEKDFTILDVGCGGGKTIDSLVRMAHGGRVCGVDYSSASVAASRRFNAQWIEAGRVDIQRGLVSSLPFPSATFDLVTAVETHYYWPDLASDFREILRVLKPGRQFVVIAEAYKGERFDWLYQPAMKLLKATYLDVPEHRELFSRAGFCGVEVFEERARGWICAVGRKPGEGRATATDDCVTS